LKKVEVESRTFRDFERSAEGFRPSISSARVVWRKAVPSAELAVFSLRRVEVGGRPFLLARLEDGCVAAASPSCPHEGADLGEGTLYMGAVNCPRHHYLYDLRTGENIYPRRVFPADLGRALRPLKLFPAKEEAGWVWIDA
jgi:nitrite reductase/ring-hydroxylating ferredoxin subunit